MRPRPLCANAIRFHYPSQLGVASVTPFTCLILGLITPCAAEAQRKIEISALRTPPTHNVRIVERMRFPYELSPNEYPPWMVMDSRKRFYREDWKEYRVRVLDSSGKQLRTIGRQGRGPGEFVNGPSPIIGRGDTVYLFDGIKAEVYSPSYERVRAATMPAFRPIRLTNGNVVTLTQTREFPPGYANFATLFRETGAKIREFRIAAAGKSPKDRSHAPRGIFSAPAGTFWVSFAERFAIEQWSESGKLLTTISILPEGDGFKNFHPTETITGNAEEVSVDQDGRAWVLCNVPNGRKYRVLSRTEGGSYQEFDADDYDSWLSVIDLKSAALLAVQKTPVRWPHFAAPGVLYGSRELENGESEIVVWNAELVPKEPGKR
jgi:hypothetical protein